MNHPYAQMMENSLRIERMERRGQLLANLGPRPVTGPARLFRRTTVPLAAEVVVRHPARETTQVANQAA